MAIAAQPILDVLNLLLGGLECAVRSVVVMLALVALSASARADATAQAREHFERGKTLYDLGRFADAARVFESAYEAKNDAAILFNVAQAYRFAGNHTKALLTYRAFLRNVPDTPNRAQVEKNIDDLQALVAKQAPPQAPASQPAASKTTQASPSAAATVTAPPRRSRVLIGAGAGLAVLGAAGIGVGAYDLAINGKGTCSLAPGQVRCPSRYDTLGLGGAFVGIGAAAAISGVVLLIIDARHRRRLHAGLLPTPSGAMLAVGGQL
jgi:tetratricopeptide (TPR) repeat protein